MLTMKRYYSLMIFLKKTLLLHKMTLMHKEVQKYHLPTDIEKYLGQGIG